MSLPDKKANERVGDHSLVVIHNQPVTNKVQSYKQKAFETNDRNVVSLPSPLSNFLVVERVQGQRIKLCVLIFSFSDSLILYLTDCSVNENWAMTVTLKPKAPKESDCVLMNK